MKKLILGVLIIMMTIVYGCSKEDDDNNKNNKYQSKIEQILNIQQKTHQEMVKQSDKVNPKFNKDEVNRYVYNDGKMIIISYPLYKENKKMFYAAYEFKKEKIYYKQGFNAKEYVDQHEADFKDIKNEQ
ncbi:MULTISPECIES: cystatin-like fold lipoprotein [Staphylococcus]|uniref:cystatin-like fold lipoprotein n=1 Tax=Staphylococcus TaxID=1279 RepID=UPI00076B23D1|nr:MULTISPECIES: cystatin-like fold lipoprotein [Staphylococcus]AMG64935.1 cystatin-like fold lipoprotein [Staphylococcus lugdunensis]MCI2814109.1 DUF4467 domain-containing protein [Staphylococcus lugdunensis]MDU0966965.1 cystatin-like fold lipoprotein [Staphylococcus lugdunensis]MDU1965733.1 cystatin-like fold lipoprotein [Staphylococcus lugdunensis]MDU2322440.1 cystatin-like fold lipoprotein [Staphylococcus lugdunensis]